jgi:hypothetical protein
MSRRKRYTRNLGRTLPAPLPARSTTAWIRFEHEDEPFGLFTYLGEARATLAGADLAYLERLVDWFNRYLDAPELGNDARERCWFRAEATDHVRYARALAALMCKAGIPIVERSTPRVPGAIRWADRTQVAVITYRDAPRSRRGPAR